MKTAVEWLERQLGAYIKGNIDELTLDDYYFLVGIAKEMENEQRQEDTNYGYSQGWDDGNQNKEPMRPELKQQEQ